MSILLNPLDPNTAGKAQLQPVGPLFPVGGSNDFPFMTDLVLLRPDRGLIICNRNTGINEETVVAVVNPQTGALLNVTHTVLAPPYNGVRSGDFGEYARWDDNTAVFAYSIGQEIPTGHNAIAYGTIDENGVIDYTLHFSPRASTHEKSTGQSLYCDPASNTVIAMYWDIYSFADLGGGYGFNTRAWGVNCNIATRTATEYQVTPTMGFPSERSAYPQYYGTLTLPGNQALGAQPQPWDPSGGGPPSTSYQMIDNHGHILHTVDTRQLTGNPNSQYGYGWLYQAGSSDTLYFIFSVFDDTSVVPFSNFTAHWWVQQYSVRPLAPVDVPRKLTRNGDSSSTLYPSFTREEWLNFNVIDSGNVFTKNYRIVNQPYFTMANTVDYHRVNIGVQDLKTGVITLGVMGDNRVYFNPTVNIPDIINVYGSPMSQGATDLIMYAFNDANGDGQVLWCQLWSVVGESPALRLKQRDDGMSIAGHARVQIPGPVGTQASSQQHGQAPRIPNFNTYT